MINSSQGFSDTQDNQKSFNERYVDSDSGPYIGTVKVTNDPLKMGRLGVNIPALTRTNNLTSTRRHSTVTACGRCRLTWTQTCW